MYPVDAGSAGVLPFAVNPKDSNIYILFGLHPKRRIGPAWEMFGGKRDAWLKGPNGLEELEWTAARETGEVRSRFLFRLAWLPLYM